MKSRKQGILEEVLNSSVKGFSSFSNVCTKKKQPWSPTRPARFYPSPDAQLTSHETL